MTENKSIIHYPRRTILRRFLQLVGRMLLPSLFKIKIVGKENFPDGGPLIVVGNHIAAMEAVLMVVYTPWPLELIGAADIPAEMITEIASRLYGFIPINRGHMDRKALTSALSVLDQGGVIGIFPEGGIWETGAMKAQTGVAWLSYRGKAAVLPIGFSGTMGAINRALRLKRPELQMAIGKPLPAAQIEPGKPRKQYYSEYAASILEAIKALLPAPDQEDEGRRNESYDLDFTVEDFLGKPVPVPEDVILRNPQALSKFFHIATILKIFKKNLRIDVGPLQTLHLVKDPRKIADAIERVLKYLDSENPYLLIYRFGPKEGRAMQDGLVELLNIARWAVNGNYKIQIQPIYRYTDANTGQEIVRTVQDAFESWM